MGGNERYLDLGSINQPGQRRWKSQRAKGCPRFQRGWKGISFPDCQTHSVPVICHSVVNLGSFGQSAVENGLARTHLDPRGA